MSAPATGRYDRDYVRDLRKARRLHSFVEERLIFLCGKLFPELHPVPEIQGLPGGRNDLLLFEQEGRKVLFEVLATRSQVSRDLRILDNTKADVKIAIIIDKEIDESVLEQFLRENPENNYPFLFVCDLFSEPGLLRIVELVQKDEDARFARKAQELNAAAKERFVRWCAENGIKLALPSDGVKPEIDFHHVLTAVVAGRMKGLGFSLDKLKPLLEWLSKPTVPQWLLLQLGLGFNMFLYTNLRDNFGFYCDTEIADFLRAGHMLPNADILINMNSVVQEIGDTFMREPPEHSVVPTRTIGSCQITEGDRGREVTVSLPSRTRKIVLVPGSDWVDTADKLRGVVQVLSEEIAPLLRDD